MQKEIKFHLAYITLKLCPMPITSVLGRLNHRQHKACRSEGLLKAASQLILKTHLPQKQKPPFSIQVWYLLILRNLELTSPEVQVLTVATLSAPPVPFPSVGILILHYLARLFIYSHQNISAIRNILSLCDICFGMRRRNYSNLHLNFHPIDTSL